MKAVGGKKSCEYYEACGNTENCSRCKSKQLRKESDY